MVPDGSILVINDHQVEEAADMATLVKICDAVVVAASRDEITAPPRHAIDFGAGQLIFTAGGNDQAVGFRAYDTFPNSKQDQVVAVWHPTTGRLAGVIVGEMLGALRTGAIGGVGINRMAAAGAHTCAVIGTGLQARTQLLACAAVRTLTRVRVFSRNEPNRRAFAKEMSSRIGVEVEPAASPAEATRNAEIVLLATSSGSPVVALDDLAAGVHVSTVGPKYLGYAELGADVVESAQLVATDSPQQIQSQGEHHFLYNSEALEKITHLGSIAARPDVVTRTVFLSAGLAGTEVLIADALLAAHSNNESTR